MKGNQNKTLHFITKLFDLNVVHNLDFVVNYPFVKILSLDDLEQKI